jgi:hypothetical protein
MPAKHRLKAAAVLVLQADPLQQFIIVFGSNLSAASFCLAIQKIPID